MWEEEIDNNSRKKAEIPYDLTLESSGVKTENDGSRRTKHNQPCPSSSFPIGVGKCHGYPT